MRTPAATDVIEAGVPSPCVNICTMSPVTGYCEGCWRTIGEIADWSTYSDGQKRAVLERLAARRNRH